jgi:hypothetical protein
VQVLLELLSRNACLDGAIQVIRVDLKDGIHSGGVD